MTAYFESNKFRARVNNLVNKFDKEKIDTIINTIKEIMNYHYKQNLIYSCAIIDKLIEPEISYSDISAFTYIFAIKLWNSHVINTNLTLLINTSNIVY